MHNLDDIIKAELISEVRFAVNHILWGTMLESDIRLCINARHADSIMMAAKTLARIEAMVADVIEEGSKR